MISVKVSQVYARVGEEDEMEQESGGEMNVSSSMMSKHHVKKTKVSPKISCTED